MPPDIVSVVGGGWSVSQIDLSKIPGTIIAINDSAIHLPRFDIVVSMDRLWTEYRYAELRKMQKPARIRRSALQNLPHKWPWLASFECDHTSAEFSDQPGVLNGINSGLCGFNLAYQMRPATILLFGFDMRRGPEGQAYWHANYPWAEKGATGKRKYDDWSRRFGSAAKSCNRAGIRTFNMSRISAIDDFPKVSIEQWLSGMD